MLQQTRVAQGILHHHHGPDRGRPKADAEAAAKEATAAAKEALPEEAGEANAEAAAAKEAAEAALDAVPKSSRAKDVWSCGAAIGDDSYATLKLKELKGKLCGSGTYADK